MSANLPDVLFLLHLLATLAMFGVIWFVQIVHYPLMHDVTVQDVYFVKNARLTAFVVVPLMLIELATGMAFLFTDLTPSYLPFSAVCLGLVLIAAAWLVTFVFQVPRHRILIQCRYNGKVVKELVNWNWLRTLAWTLRAFLLLWSLFSALQGS